MNLKFVFLTFLVLSGALAQATADPAKQATCIRNTLNKLSEEGRVHAFGIRVTTESNVTLDSRFVGGSLSEITTTAIDRTQIISEDPVTETVAPLRESEKAPIKFADLTKIEKNPFSEVYDANEKKSATTKKISFKETKEQVKSLINDAKLLEVECKAGQKKLSELNMNLEADRKLYQELKGKIVRETNPAKIEELKEEIQHAAVKIETIKSQKAVEAKKLEAEQAKLQEVTNHISSLKKESSDLDKEAKEQIVIINGQKFLKKNLEKLTLTEAELKEEKGQLKILEDKAKLIIDSKEAERISQEIQKKQLKVEQLRIQEAKIEKSVRQQTAKVEEAKQIIEEIKREAKQAEEKEIAKFGSKCTSYSIRPQVKYCISWKTENGNKVCDQYKDVYRVEKCLKTDVSGTCIKKTYSYDAKAGRYQCESHSTEFAKDQCMQWAEKDGKAVCSKTETFYQSKTCVLFNQVGSEVKCMKYDTAYPAFKCSKTFEVAGKKTCKEMSAYNPTYFCKEYMLVDGHRFCKVQELFYGKEVNSFACDVKEQMKDANGEVHCMKYRIKKLDQFKDFKLNPISTETVRFAQTKAPVTERECKKIEKTIQKEKVIIQECNKKILEMEKTISRTKSQVEKLICKKIILQEQAKIAATEHKIAVEKEIKDKIVSEQIMRQRAVGQLKNERRDAQGRIVVEAEIISTCNKKIREAKDKLKTETSPAKIEELQRTISEESQKKKNCQIKIITATKTIETVDADIRKSKVNVETLKLEVQKKNAEALIKKTAEVLVEKQNALIKQAEVIKTTVDETIKRKIAEEIKSLQDEIKSGKITLEKEKSTFQKICRKETAAVQKEAKREITNLITKEAECKKVIMNMQKVIDNSSRREEIEVAREKIRTIIVQQAQIKKDIVEIKHKEEFKKIEIQQEKKVVEKEAIKTVEIVNKVIEAVKPVTETTKKTDDPISKKITVELVAKKTVETVTPSKNTEEIKRTVEIITPSKKTVETVTPSKNTEEIKRTVEIITPSKKTVETVTPSKNTEEIKFIEQPKKTIFTTEQQKVVIDGPKKTVETVIEQPKSTTVHTEVKKVVVEEPRRVVVHDLPKKITFQTEERRQVIEEPKKTTVHSEVKRVEVEEPKKVVVGPRHTVIHTEERRIVIEHPKRTTVHTEEKQVEQIKRTVSNTEGKQIVVEEPKKITIEEPKRTIVHTEVRKITEEPSCKEEKVVLEVTKKSPVHTEIKKVNFEEPKRTVFEEPKKIVDHTEVKKVVVEESKKTASIEEPKKTVIHTEVKKVVHEPSCKHESVVIEQPKKTIVQTEERRQIIEQPKSTTVHTEVKKVVVEEPRRVVVHDLPKKITFQTEERRQVIEEPKKTTVHSEVKRVEVEEPKKVVVGPRHTVIHTEERRIVIEHPKRTTVHTDVKKVVEEPTCKEENVVISRNIIIEEPKKTIVSSEERKVVVEQPKKIIIEEPKRTVVHTEIKKVIAEVPMNVVEEKKVIIEQPKSTTVHTEVKKVVVEEPRRVVVHDLPKKITFQTEERRQVIEEPKKTTVHSEVKRVEVEEPKKVVVGPRHTVIHTEERRIVIEHPKRTTVHTDVKKVVEEPTCKEENVVISRNVVVEEPKKTVIRSEDKKVVEEPTCKEENVVISRNVVVEEPKKTVIRSEDKKVVEEPKKTIVFEEPKKTIVQTEIKKVVEEPSCKEETVAEFKKVVQQAKPTTITIVKELKPTIVEVAEAKKNFATEVRNKEIAKIDNQTAISIVKDMKHDAITRVHEIYRKEQQACVDTRAKLRSVLEEADEQMRLEQTQKLMEQIRIAEAEKKTSQIILDMLNKIKCTCAAASSHKKLMAAVLKKLKAVNPDAIIEFKLFRTKKALKRYLKSNHYRYLQKLARGNKAAYTRRFYSWRVAYRRSRKLASSYKAGYVYCNRSKRWIKTHSFRVNGKSCGCKKIIKKYKIYARRVRKYRRVMRRNHISIRRTRSFRRVRSARRFRTVRRRFGVRRGYRTHSVSCRRRAEPRVPVSTYQVRRPIYRDASCGRMLQATNLTNNNDITLVQTFKDHLASFKVEDRTLLAKCLA